MQMEIRPLIKEGSSAHPKLVGGNEAMTLRTNGTLYTAYKHAWDMYELLLNDGVANEVARTILPVGIYSEMYVTMNLRAMFNFLSLRTSNDNSTYPSSPQWEIEQVAFKLEEHVKQLFPSSYKSWCSNGRVAP